MPPLRALFALLLLLAAPLPAQAGQLEDDVLAELNYARAHPARYAQELRRAAASGPSDNGPVDLFYEDPDAVDEAIGFLMSQPPLPPLRPHEGLAAAAAAYANAQARRGGEGHGRGVEDLGRRLQRQGVWAGLTAENISYGYDSPREVVLQLIVDSRVPNRGHRKTIFGRNFQAAGVACGPHAAHGAMCVIDFAGALVQR
jgi:hypothetical protein